MKLTLRVIAILIATSVVLTVQFVFWFWSSGRLPLLLRDHRVGPLTLVCWAGTLLIGPYATVQLWRLRRSGLNASVVLAAIATLYYVGGGALAGPNVSLQPIILAAIINGAVVAVLLSPAARRTCTPVVRPN